MRKTLTAEGLKAEKLPKGKRALEVYDRECPGLVLRIGPNSRTFAFYFRHEGKFYKTTIGNALNIELVKARKAAREMRELVQAGADPRGAAEDEARPEIFNELADRWMERYAKANRKTFTDDEMLLRVHAVPHLGAKRLLVIDGPTMSRMHAAIMKNEREKEIERAGRLKRPTRQNAGARIADRVVGLVKSIFRWGVPLGYVTGDPTVGLRKAAGKRGSGKAGRERVLSDAEITGFLRALPTIFPDEQWQIIARLALMLGCRKSEVADIEQKELHLEAPAPFWLLPAGRAKNKHDHLIPLPPAAVVLIRRAQEIIRGSNRLGGKSDFLFPSAETGKPAAATGLHIALRRAFHDGTIKVRDPVKGFMTAQKRGAILTCEPFTVHDLRRSAATGMARLGIDRLVIAKCLNHRTADHATVTGLIYDRHDYAVEKRVALERWATHVNGLEAGAISKVDMN